MIDGLQLEATRRGAVPSCHQNVGLGVEGTCGMRWTPAFGQSSRVWRQYPKGRGRTGNVRGREREWGGKDLELFGEGTEMEN